MAKQHKTTKLKIENLAKWLPVFLGLTACSWMPHWSCHYYRIETNSSLIVGSWDYTILDSFLFMVIYSGLISLNLLAIIKNNLRFSAILSSGVLHLVLAIVHIVRLIKPFEFEVFGYEWSEAASIREIIIVGIFGLTCLYFAFLIKKLRFNTN